MARRHHRCAVQECHRKYAGEDPKFRALLDTTLEIVEEEVGTLRRLVGNFSNFNLPPNTMTGLLQGGGAINGTGKAAQDTFRVGNGTGVYSLGAPPELEFGLRLTF